MSVKTMAQVWDMDIPQNEKLVLLAYADHADHNGCNIFPAVATVAKKTGYSERSVQRTTKELEAKGLLIADGKGPKGTNKWKFGGGDILSGVTNETQGVTSETKKGDIAVTPEPSLTIKEPSNIVQTPKFSDPVWDMLHGKDFKPSPEQLALERIHQTWERVMKDAPDWSRWGAFDRWLLQKEQGGQSVEQFCQWFASDAFRMKQIGMWSPNGTKENKYSFKRVYPQAFESSLPPAQQSSPEETERLKAHMRDHMQKMGVVNAETA